MLRPLAQRRPEERIAADARETGFHKRDDPPSARLRVTIYGFFTIVALENATFDLPPGTHEAQIADGWWLLLDGPHAVHVRAVLGAPDDPLFAVTYT